MSVSETLLPSEFVCLAAYSDWAAGVRWSISIGTSLTVFDSFGQTFKIFSSEPSDGTGSLLLYTTGGSALSFVPQEVRVIEAVAKKRLEGWVKERPGTPLKEDFKKAKIESLAKIVSAVDR